jgi:hypothetical protein
MQDNTKKFLIDVIGLVIKHEPIKLGRLINQYIKDGFLYDYLITSSNDVKIFFHDQSTVAFNQYGRVIYKTLKRKRRHKCKIFLKNK